MNLRPNVLDPMGLCPICHQWARVWWGKLGRHKTKDYHGNPVVCLGSAEIPEQIKSP